MINELVNKIGNANHEIAVASQEMDKELEAAKKRLANVDALNEQAKKLANEVADLKGQKAQLEAEVKTLKDERARILAKFGGA